MVENLGERLSIDETLLGKELRTILTNKEGHGKKGSLVAICKGTKPENIIAVLMRIPEEKRLAVKEVTMDFSDSMYAIVKAVFPNATIVIDCFHIIKRCLDAAEEIRLKDKRKAVKEQNHKKAEFNKKKQTLAKNRKRYRAKHPKSYKGKKRGRKPMRLNARYVPERLSNGDTKLDLLTRSKRLLAMSADKWGARQKERMGILFSLYPKIREAYSLTQSLRSVFRKKITREQAAVELQKWYNKVAQSTLREVKAARDLIKSKEEEVLNYFINRSTNASAESINSKMKGFRADIHGVQDLPFFLFRCAMIFG